MPNPLRILTFDVAHGNCHAIWFPSGKLVIIDLGTSDDFSPLKWLKSQGIKAIDLLILTHPHDDHIRGFRDLDGITVKTLHRPKNIPADLTTELDLDLKREWDKHDARFSTPVQPSDKFYDPTSPAFEGVSLHFFGGKSDSANLNNYSIVAVLEYAGFKIVFPGDIESSGWTELLKNAAFKNTIKGTVVLVAPHHGREAGWHAELFDHVSPMLVVVSDGSWTETSFVSQYHQKSRGAKVTAKNNNEIKDRYVVSTRDNGHIDINVSVPNGTWSFTANVDTH
jgi:beta-lactamase superfamily II metal-dependent hydrolase